MEGKTLTTRLLGAVLACATFSTAGDIQSWNRLDFTVLRTGRVTWTGAAALRIRDDLGEVNDRRALTAVDVALGRRFMVTGGYMVRQQARAGFGLDWNQRAVAQIGYGLGRIGPMHLSGATAYEREIDQAGVRDFNRYRQRFVLDSSKAGISPWFYEDLNFLRRGFRWSRSRVGIQWRGRAGYTVRFGYQFEALRDAALQVVRPRHAILAIVSIDRPLWQRH